MNLTIKGNTEKGIRYVPDWLKLTFKNDKHEIIELTLDVQGYIEIGKPDNKNQFAIRCKVDLIPWIERNIDTDEEKDYSDIIYDDAVALYPEERLVKIIRQSTEHIVGLYPFEADDFKESENDVITDCTLTLEINRSEVVFNCYSVLNI